jgi:hypothetical protein
VRTSAEQRTLTLVSKSVYNLMNNIPFGDKEPFMTPMNAFISEYNVNVVQQFMRDLVVRVCLARPCARLLDLTLLSSRVYRTKRSWPG